MSILRLCDRCGDAVNVTFRVRFGKALDTILGSAIEQSGSKMLDLCGNCHHDLTLFLNAKAVEG